MTTTSSHLVDLYGRPLMVDRGPRGSALGGSYHNQSRSDRTRQGTRGPLGSANAHHDPRTLQDLIRDSQALARNSVITRALLRTAVDCVVGDRVTADPRTDDPKWNAMVQRRFARWGDELCDITGLQSLTGLAGSIVEAQYTDGGALAHKVALNGVHCKLEMIEAVRLMNQGNGPDTRHRHGGVEVNPTTGRAAFYWIAAWNPTGSGLDFRPVPYGAEHFLMVNNHRHQAAGQYRTAPRLAASIDKIEALETACKSTMGAYQLATFMALFITRQQAAGVSTEDALAQYMVSQGMAQSPDEARDRGVWAPMSIMEGQPGEGVTQIKPEHPTLGWDTMFWTELQTIFGEQGYPLELAFMRFIKNWSASKSAISVAWRSVRKDQEHLKRTFLVPVYHWWLANEIRQGRVPVPAGERDEWMKVDFIQPQQPVLDPLIETKAALLGLAGGVKRHRTALLEMGQGDREDFMADFIDERRTNLAAGLSYGEPVQNTRSESVSDDEGSGGDGGNRPDDTKSGTQGNDAPDAGASDA